MRPAPACSAAFFLDVAPGTRYCLLHAGPAPHACVVYLQPFADEMNKSRRMAALQARALAGAGFAVLQIDLYGCGDSSGEFACARWQQWIEDAAAAVAYMQARFDLPVLVWGLRLGALLALDVAHRQTVAGLLLWQPVLNGATFLTQFLRLRTAGAMLTGDTDGGTRASRATLAAGGSLEVAGYPLSAALAADLDGIDAASLTPSCPLAWFEIAPDAGRPPAPASVRLAGVWSLTAAAAPRMLVGPAFWHSQEIEIAPALLDASVEALAALARGARHG